MTEGNYHQGRGFRRAAGLAGAALLLAACSTSVDGGNGTALNQLVDRQGQGTGPGTLTLNDVPANRISLIDGGQPKTIHIETSNGLPVSATDQLAEIHSTDSKAVLPVAFDTSAARKIGANERALYNKLRADLAEPHPLAVTLVGQLYPLESKVRGSDVIFEITDILPQNTSQRTTTLAPRTGQLPTNQAYSRPRRV